jgi:uncharacterized protein
VFRNEVRQRTCPSWIGGSKLNNKTSTNTGSPEDKPLKNKRRKQMKIVGILLGLLIIVFVAIPIITVYKFIDIHVSYKEVYRAEEFGLSSEKLMLTTEDGLKIAAHEVFTEEPKAVVIYLSGIHNPSVTAFFGHSKMLKENGYASILLELRAHGESEGKTIGLGYTEHLDTRALVGYIKSKDKYKNVPIVIHGASMGGAAAINSFSQIPEIDGLISMSAFSSWEDVLCDSLMVMGIPRIIAYAQKPFTKLHATFKYGFKSFYMTPKHQIKNSGHRPMLLGHSTEDDEVPIANFKRIMKNAPEHAETWVREGYHHFMVERDKLLNPEKDIEYSDIILNFLENNFAEQNNR